MEAVTLAVSFIQIPQVRTLERMQREHTQPRSHAASPMGEHSISSVSPVVISILRDLTAKGSQVSRTRDKHTECLKSLWDTTGSACKGATNMHDQLGTTLLHLCDAHRSLGQHSAKIIRYILFL